MSPEVVGSIHSIPEPRCVRRRRPGDFAVIAAISANALGAIRGHRSPLPLARLTRVASSWTTGVFLIAARAIPPLSARSSSTSTDYDSRSLHSVRECHPLGDGFTRHGPVGEWNEGVGARRRASQRRRMGGRAKPLSGEARRQVVGRRDRGRLRSPRLLLPRSRTRVQHRREFAGRTVRRPRTSNRPSCIPRATPIVRADPVSAPWLIARGWWGRDRPKWLCSD